MTRQNIILCLVLLFSALAAPALAHADGDGINSTSGTPLPIGAGGHTAVTILPNGNVGVGTTNPVTPLDVNGGVKVGSATTCDPAHAGTIKWDGAYFYGCNGSIWQKFSDTTGSCFSVISRQDSGDTFAGCPYVLASKSVYTISSYQNMAYSNCAGTSYLSVTSCCTSQTPLIYEQISWGSTGYIGCQAGYVPASTSWMSVNLWGGGSGCDIETAEYVTLCVKA